mgnify:CR=1 FL=1
MTSRRQLLRGVAGSLSVFGGLRWGGLVAPADAQTDETVSDSNASDDSDRDEASDDDEGDPTGLPGYTVGQIYLRYEEHVGITTFVELENQTEQNRERVRLKADAYGPNETMGSDQTWKGIPASFERAVKLRIDNVFDLYNAVDNVTEFVIRGRVPGGESDVIAAFSGSRFREGIETDGPTKPDGGTDAAVEVQQETASDAAGDETTAGGETDETTQAGGETAGDDDDTATDEGTGTETAGDEGDPTDQTGVDVSNPEDVVSTGDDSENDDGGGNDGGDDSDNDGGGNAEDNDGGDDGGGGLLQSLSFGLLGG